MENASKALLIAGGVLLALLVISSLVMLLTNLQDYQNKTDASVLETQIAKYNSQYNTYDKDGLTLMELKSVYNKMESNNKEHPELEIKSNILVSSGAKVINKTISICDYYLKPNFATIPEDHKIIKRFKCINVEYKGRDGRISRMDFIDNTPSEREAKLSYWLNLIHLLERFGK